MAPLGGIGAGLSGGGIGLPLELIDGAKKATGGAKAVDGAAEAGGTNFAAVLKDKLSSLNAQQADSAAATQDLATGRVDDIAQTMIRIEQASVSLQMATQVRNKVIESYQEIMRMQM